MAVAISSIRMRVSCPEDWAGALLALLGSSEAVQLMLAALEINIGGWRFLFTGFRLPATSTLILFGAFVFSFVRVFLLLISVTASTTRIVRRSVTGEGNRRQAHGGDIIRHI